MNSFKEGDKVIIVSQWDLTTPNKTGTVVKYRPERGEVRVDNDWYYAANVFPISAEQDIHRVQVTRDLLRLALSDSMTLVYELANKKARGEYK